MKDSQGTPQPFFSDADASGLAPEPEARPAPRRVSFVVPAETRDKKGRLIGPQTWQRAGIRNGQHFTAKATREAKGVTRDAAERVLGGAPPLTGPLSARILFVFPALGGGPKAGRPREWKATRPDSDNLAKLVLDAVNEVAFGDDGQVARLVAEKVHGATGEPPRTEVVVEQLAGPPPGAGGDEEDELAVLEALRWVRSRLRETRGDFGLMFLCGRWGATVRGPLGEDVVEARGDRLVDALVALRAAVEAKA